MSVEKEEREGAEGNRSRGWWGMGRRRMVAEFEVLRGEALRVREAT